MADTKLSALGVVSAPAASDIGYTVQGGVSYQVADLNRITGGLKALTATATKTGNYTAVASDLVICNTAGGAFTVTLPAAPGFGQRVGILLLTAGNNLTVGRNGKNIDGAAADLTISIASTVRVLEYTGAAWVTVSASGRATLASSFALTTSGTPEDIGLSVVLPTPGLYIVGYNVRTTLAITGHTSAFTVAKLYDSTGAADIADSMRLVILLQAATVLAQAQSAFTEVVSVTAASTIKLYCSRNASAGTFTTSTITSDSNGWTTLNYLKVA